MTESVQSVVAGSKGFVEAMGATLRIRLGAAPRVARDPVEAVRAGDAVELVVVECGGPEWLGAVRDLRTHRDRAACGIVAALPALRMSEADALRAAGADEAVRWDGRVDPVVWAVDRVVAARARAAPQQAAPAHVPTPAAAATDAPEPAPESAFELRELQGEAPAAVEDAGPLLIPIESAPASPPGAGSAPAALADLPGDEEVEALLAEYLRSGQVAPELRAVTEAIAATLSELEKAALLGQAVACDPAPLRRAVALRWRVRVVLAHARAAGGGVEPAAAQALPAQIDAALAALVSVADGAPAELALAIASVRNALVSVAVELTEAIARLANDAVAPAPAAAPSRATRRTRVLSNDRAHADERPAIRRGWLIALAAVALLVLAYHAPRWWSAPVYRAAPTVAGAPPSTMVVTIDRTRMLMARPGAQVTAADLDAVKDQQRLLGYTLREIGPGTWALEPAEAARGAVP